MSAKAREYDAKIAGLIQEAGGRITSRGKDGSGHNVIGFQCRGYERCFHYPSTGRTNGHGFKNVSQRLKWLIAEIPAEPPEPYPMPPTEQVWPPAAIVIRQQHHAAESALPKLRLTKPKRAEIIKRYLEPGATLDTIVEEFGMKRDAAETLLLAIAGAVRSKYDRERHARRAANAKLMRQAMQPIVDVQRSLTAEDKRRIFVLHFYGVPSKDVARRYGIRDSYVRQITAKEKRRVR